MREMVFATEEVAMYVPLGLKAIWVSVKSATLSIVRMCFQHQPTTKAISFVEGGYVKGLRMEYLHGNIRRRNTNHFPGSTIIQSNNPLGPLPDRLEFQLSPPLLRIQHVDAPVRLLRRPIVHRRDNLGRGEEFDVSEGFRGFVSC